MFAVAAADILREVEVVDGRGNIARVGEGGGEVEQKAVARQNRVDVLSLRVFVVALVRLVQQDEPSPVVVIVAEVYNLFLLLVAEVVGAVVEDGDFVVLK
jgi:hypothetical protein